MGYLQKLKLKQFLANSQNQYLASLITDIIRNFEFLFYILEKRKSFPVCKLTI